MKAPSCPSWIPVRYIFTFLAFIGFVFNYTLRVNINLVITSMINQTALADHEMLNSTARVDGPFVWDSVVRNDVIGLFFAGYMVFQMPGGRLAEVWGGKRVLALAMGSVSALTLLIPVAANLGGKTGYPYYLVIIRFLMGLCEAGTFPCVLAMLARWAPESERSTMSALIMAGSQVGTIVGFYISGVLVDWLGWEAVFYIEGGACFVWLLFWILLASDTPSTHPTITQEEREYIESGLPATSEESPPIPWKSIWTSLPFWAILVANFANNWGFHLLMTELPQYLSEVFPEYMDTSSKKGLWTAIPYTTMWVVSLVVSTTSDKLIRSGVLRTVVVRKVCNTLAHIGPSVCLLMIVLFVNNSDLRLTFTLVMFTVGVGCMGALYSAWITNPQDIAPNFAGTVLGLTNCIGSIPGFVAPAIAAQIVNDSIDDTNKWDIVWIMTIALLALESLFYIIFASGTAQPWNNLENTSTKKGRDWFSIIWTSVIFLAGILYVVISIVLHAKE